MATTVNWLKVGSTAFPSPSTYQWDLEDVSKSDAGRTEAGKMYKKKIGFVRALSVSWKYLTTAQISAILQAITNKEYFYLTFLCPLSGGITSTEVYVGNRTAPLYNKALDCWESLSVKFVERSVHN